MAEMTTALSGFGDHAEETSNEAVKSMPVQAEGSPQYTFEVSGMDLFYDKTQALKNINMNIEQKQITALIGPSGCGKSTFIKTLNRMNDFVEGCRVSGDIRF